MLTDEHFPPRDSHHQPLKTDIKLKLEYHTDQQIVKAILERDASVTKAFLYQKCYPMFKSIYDKYYTDCENCFELINEIYVYIMLPHKDTHLSKLASFGFRCTCHVAEDRHGKLLPTDLCKEN